MNERNRIKIITEAQKFGAISLRYQSLRLHKNGAKFPISKVYIDDKILDPQIQYTLVLIPEAKVAETTIVALTFFQRKMGPVLFYYYPENKLKDFEIEELLDGMEKATKKNLFIHQSTTISTINYYFELQSDWARGNKEMLLVSILLALHTTPKIEQKIFSLCSEFSQKLQNLKDIYKALYIKQINTLPLEEHPNINKDSTKLKSEVQNLYNKIKVLT